MHEVIKEMEEPDRTIFILRFFYYETVKVIAETVHLKEDNVESRIRRGKKHRKKTKYMKAAAVAACVLIVAPTTIYGKEIQRFFQSKWKQNIFRMEVQVTKEKKSKQNVSLDTLLLCQDLVQVKMRVSSS